MEVCVPCEMSIGQACWTAAKLCSGGLRDTDKQGQHWISTRKKNWKQKQNTTHIWHSTSKQVTLRRERGREGPKVHSSVAEEMKLAKSGESNAMDGEDVLDSLMK